MFNRLLQFFPLRRNGPKPHSDTFHDWTTKNKKILLLANLYTKNTKFSDKLIQSVSLRSDYTDRHKIFYISIISFGVLQLNMIINVAQLVFIFLFGTGFGVCLFDLFSIQ